MDQVKEMFFAVEKSVIEEIAKHLAGQPWHVANPLMAKLSTVKPINLSEPVENKESVN